MQNYGYSSKERSWIMPWWANLLLVFAGPILMFLLFFLPAWLMTHCQYVP